MNVNLYEHDNPEKLKRFIVQCGHLPFLEYGVKREMLGDYIIEDLSEIVSNEGSVFIAEEAEEVIGLIASKRLDWDSKHFGIETAKISYLLALGDYCKSLNTKQKLVSHLLANCYDKLTLHLSARVNKEDLSSIHALESRTFRLMGVLVTYSLDLRNKKIKGTLPNNIRCFEPSDLPSLVEIALECFGRSEPNSYQ